MNDPGGIPVTWPRPLSQSVSVRVGPTQVTLVNALVFLVPSLPPQERTGSPRLLDPWAVPSRELYFRRRIKEGQNRAWPRGDIFDCKGIAVESPLGTTNNYFL